MRRPALTAALAIVLLATGVARAAPLTPAKEATVTANTGMARDNDTCRRAWRCGPYDCGWRQICASATQRPNWQGHHYFWRRHQWRRHYW